MKDAIDNYFKISLRNSTIKKEIIGGVVAYLSMAYIIFVNPIILSDAGMNADAVFTATIFASAIATIVMGLYANYPLGLAPCMSMNAFFSYTVVLSLGFSWEEALACVFVSSIIFIILSVTKVRYKIIDSIPKVLKQSATVGLGLFISFVGLQNAELIVITDQDRLAFGNLSNPNVIIAIVGIIVACIFVVRKSNFAVIYGMIAAVCAGLLISFLNINEFLTLSPAVASSLPALPTTLFQSPTVPLAAMFNDTFLVAIKTIPSILTVSGISVILSFVFLDFFGTAATLMAVTSQIDKSDSHEEQKVYLADAIGTFSGSILGTSNVTTYIESASGVNAGARTGLMACVCGILFALSIFLYPLLSLVTSAVTTPALFIIGVYMIKNLRFIDWGGEFEKIIPAFLTIILMPFTGSITLGLTFGFVAYTGLMLVAKRQSEIDLTFYVVSFISLVYIITSI